MPIAIRPAVMDDIPALAAMRALGSESEDYWNTRIAAYLRGSHSPQQALRERAAFVAADEGHIVGWIAGHRTRRYACDAELQWIDVIAEYRGRGIAGRLLAAMGAWFVEMDAMRVCVDVQPDNEPARRLYTRHGAVSLNPHWMMWKDARTLGSGLRPSA